MEGPMSSHRAHDDRHGYGSQPGISFSTVPLSQDIQLQEGIRRPQPQRFSTDFLSSGQIDSNESTRVSTPNNEHDVEKLRHNAPQPGPEGAVHMGYNIYDPRRPRLSLKQRLNHFTMAWWTLIMSTGGLSLLMYAQPYQFPGLRQIGMAIYALTLFLFTLVLSTMITRFVLYPSTLKASVCHAREGLFFPTFFLSLATIITSSYRYVVPTDADDATGANTAVRAAFWCYVGATLSVAVGQYSYFFRTHSMDVRSMMPTWILPIFPVMLSGTIASVIAEGQPGLTSVPVVYTGLACQGLGISVSFLMYAHMVGRLMQSGLPDREHRPGLFMNVGPPAFTCLALIGMANGLPDGFGGAGGGDDAAVVFDVQVVRQIAVLAGVYLWGLSLWWFGVGLVAVLARRPKYFHLGWWAGVFPNTGFTLATITLGKAIGSEVVLKFAVFMTICIVVTYCYVLFHNIRAVLVQDIMYPGRDEDVLDH